MVPDDVAWSAVSPRLALGRRIVACGSMLVLAVVVVVVAGVVGSPRAFLGALVPLALGGWVWWLIGRQVTAIAYAERDEDLLVRKGVMFRSLVVVPYGRMQYVDLQSGPLQRAFGIATVELHTATPQTDAQIPGLKPDDAARLREKLATLGNTQASGL